MNAKLLVRKAKYFFNVTKVVIAIVVNSHTTTLSEF